MSKSVTDELKQRAGKAIVAHAFFRVESALTICLTILLAFFMPRPLAWWRWWYWLIMGAVAEALVVYTSITDERTAAVVVGEMLRARYDPAEIKTRSLRQKVEQALQYREQIERIIAGLPMGVLRDHLYDSTKGIADWIGTLFAIAKRLDVYTRDDLLHRDMREVPASIPPLYKALAQERDATVRQQIEATLAAKKAQQVNLEALQNKMEEAEFLLEETLTALGTVYSQFQLISAQKLGGAEARNLSLDIREQVQRLQDILASMNQVYGRS